MSPLAEPVASWLVALLGLVIGSFLNVCIHRLPRGQSVAWPGSRCPSCGSPILWYQNIPLVSWLALRGRCAACAARISFRYPLVEGLSAGLLLALWRGYGASFEFLVAAPFALSLVVLFFTDLDLQLLPDAVTLPGVAAGLGLAAFNPFLGEGTWQRLFAATVGAALGAGLLWSIGAAYSRLRGVEAMGLGDVKMMAMVGSFSGALGVLFTLFAASLAGAVVGVALVPLRGKSLKDTLPFGCFLAPAALVALLAGRRAIEGYLHFVGITGAGP